MAETPPFRGFARWLIVIAVMLAVFMDILDMTIVNIALPHMMGSLGANSEEIAWVLTSYMISAVAIMPLSGYLADRFGQRRVLLFDMVAFTITSALCGLSQNLDQIVPLPHSPRRRRCNADAARAIVPAPSFPRQGNAARAWRSSPSPPWRRRR